MRKAIILTAIMMVASQALAVYGLGDTVEDFTLLTPAGEPVNFSDFEGNVILLNFFATW